MISNISEIFSNISLVENGYYYLKLELNADLLEETEVPRYNIGFAIDDMGDNAWPMPRRNLNNTGKILIPNYGFPSLPETLAELVLSVLKQEEPETNSIQYMIPGIQEPQIELSFCAIDPDDWELKEPTFVTRLSVNLDGYTEY